MRILHPVSSLGGGVVDEFVGNYVTVGHLPCRTSTGNNLHIFIEADAREGHSNIGTHIQGLPFDVARSRIGGLFLVSGFQLSKHHMEAIHLTTLLFDGFSVAHYLLVLVFHEGTAVFIDNVLSEEHGVGTAVLSASAEQQLAFLGLRHGICSYLDEIVSAKGDVLFFVTREFLPGYGMFQFIVLLELKIGNGVERFVVLGDDITKCRGIVGCLIYINIVRVVKLLCKLLVTFHKLWFLPLDIIVFCSLYVDGTKAVTIVVRIIEFGMSDSGFPCLILYDIIVLYNNNITLFVLVIVIIVIIIIVLVFFLVLIFVVIAIIVIIIIIIVVVIILINIGSVLSLVNGSHYDGYAISVIFVHTVGGKLGIRACGGAPHGFSVNAYGIVLALLEISLGVRYGKCGRLNVVQLRTEHTGI